jgi:predicted Zn-dependent protease
MFRAAILFFALSIPCKSWGQKDVAWDIKVGDETAVKIERAVGVYSLQRADSAVKSIGNRLVGQVDNNPYQFTFKVLDQEEPNAFALPGGHVYVSRGLLLLVKSEDELAGVLGHEISHVILRHSAQQRKKVLPKILLVPGAIIGSVVGEDLGNPLLGAGKLLMSSYSRKQETEADERGIAIAAKAGYRPLALSAILQRIQQMVETATGEVAKFSLMDDHPMTPDRMRDIEKMNGTITVAPRASSYQPGAIQRTLSGLLVGPSPGKGIFNRNTFLHPKMNIYWTLPDGWNYANEASAAGGVGKDGQLVLTIVGQDTRMDTIIEKFVNNYYKQTRYRPISDKKISLQGREGAELIISGSERKNILYTVWFKKDGFTYVIMGKGATGMTDTFRNSALTFRDLQPTDYPLIKQRELVLVPAVDGETITGFNERTGSELKVKMAAIINGVPENHTFVQGEIVKGVIRVPYKPIE